MLTIQLIMFTLDLTTDRAIFIATVLFLYQNLASGEKMSFHDDIQAYYRLANPNKPEKISEAIVQAAKYEFFVLATVTKKRVSFTTKMAVKGVSLVEEKITLSELTQAIDKLLLDEPQITYSYLLSEASDEIIFSFVYQCTFSGFHTF